MNDSNTKLLKELCLTYGIYKVAVAVMKIAEEECKTNYADNPDAVIHRDFNTLKDCIEKMKMNHFFRFSD